MELVWRKYGVSMEQVWRKCGESMEIVWRWYALKEILW